MLLVHNVNFAGPPWKSVFDIEGATLGKESSNK